MCSIRKVFFGLVAHAIHSFFASIHSFKPMPQQAFIVKVELDDSIDPESIRREIELTLTDIFNSGEFTVATWSAHNNPNPLSAPPPSTPFPPM